MTTPPRRIPAWCSSIVTTVVLIIGIAVGAVIILTHLGTPVTGNLGACQQYKAQRTWASGAAASAANVRQFAADLGADAGQSAGKLHAALETMVYDVNVGLTLNAPSVVVLAECEALGVKFTPAP